MECASRPTRWFAGYRTSRLRADEGFRRGSPGQAGPGGQEPDGPSDQQGDAAVRPLEESSVRRQPDAICKRRLEDQGGRSEAGRGGPCAGRPRGTQGAGEIRGGLRTLLPIFPDTFFVSERARVYLDPKQEKKNAGRLLSAGFHSMTGYFRDDGPLYELMLDAAGQKELDRLWREFDFITGVPMRQYASYLWFERAETGFLKGTRRSTSSEPRTRTRRPRPRSEAFAKVYLAKARRLGASDRGHPARSRTSSASSARRFGASNGSGSRPSLATSRPSRSSPSGRFADRFPPRNAEASPASTGSLREEDGLNHEDAVRDTFVSILMSPHFCYRVDRIGDRPGVHPLSDYDLASRLSYFLWASMPDRELLDHAAAGDLHEPEVLAAQARRMLRTTGCAGSPPSSPATGSTSADSRSTTASIAGGSRRSTTNCGRRCSRSRSASSWTSSATTARCSNSSTASTRSSIRSLARHYGMPDPDRRRRTTGSGSTTRPDTAAAGCCRWRCS